MRANQLIAVPFWAGAALITGACTPASSRPPVEIVVIEAGPEGDAAALRAELGERSREVEDLKAEIDHLRLREEDLTERLRQALRRSPGRTISDRPLETEGAASEATIRDLQATLRDERAKRQKLETQLAQLRIETSTPPLPDARPLAVPEPEIEAPEPVVEASLPPPAAPLEEDVLEEVVSEEPAEPAPPLQVAAVSPPPYPAPEPRASSALPPGAGLTVEIEALRMRGIEQETRHQEAIANLARVLDADRRRQEDLEAQLAALSSGAPGTEGALAADSNELSHLRGRLEEERRRNAELTAKLKLAGRVTDLVFRMQQQPQAAPAQAPPPAYPRYSQQDLFPDPNAADQPYIDREGNVNQPIAPEVPAVEAPEGVGEVGQPSVPGVEQPGVFGDRGPVVVEEVTQD